MLLLLAAACLPAPSSPTELPPPLPGFEEPTPNLVAIEPPPWASPPFQALTMQAQDPDQQALIIALHGHGAWPSRMVQPALPWTHFARVVLPAAPTPWFLGWTWFSADPRKDTPELAQQVGDMADRLADWVRQLDGDPVIVTGFSQGAMLAYAMAVRHPDIVDAAVPIAGYLPSALMPEEVPADPPPIVSMHGLDDDIIRVELDSGSVDALHAMGWPAELYTWEGVAHVIPEDKVSVIELKVRAVSEGRPVLRSSRR